MILPRPPGDVISLVHLRSVLTEGEVFLFRNPKGRPFGDNDTWELHASWKAPNGIAAAYQQVLKEEDKIARSNPFAWNAEFGYLSPFPEHCGTGLVLRGTFHLEGLNLLGDLPATLNAVHAVRFHAAGVNMDNLKDAGHVYDVFSTAALGVTEEDLIRRTIRLFEMLVRQELAARAHLVNTMPRVFADSVSRAIAILRSCRLVSPWELLDILSPIRLAATYKMLDGITLAEVDALMRKQRNTPDDLPHNTEGDHARDTRDARLADRINRLFSRVSWTERAKDYFA